MFRVLPPCFIHEESGTRWDPEAIVPCSLAVLMRARAIRGEALITCNGMIDDDGRERGFKLCSQVKPRDSRSMPAFGLIVPEHRQKTAPPQQLFGSRSCRRCPWALGCHQRLVRISAPGCRPIRRSRSLARSPNWRDALCRSLSIIERHWDESTSCVRSWHLETKHRMDQAHSRCHRPTTHLLRCGPSGRTGRLWAEQSSDVCNM